MKHYSKSYQASHDIDYFVREDGKWYHYASNGYRVPEFVSREWNRVIQCAVYSVLQKNPERTKAIRTFLGEQGQIDNANEYLRSFESMAGLGFISCDCVSEEDAVVVAEPISGAGTLSEDLQEELCIVLSEYRKMPKECKNTLIWKRYWDNIDGEEKTDTISDQDEYKKVA